MHFFEGSGGTNDKRRVASLLLAVLGLLGGLQLEHLWLLLLLSEGKAIERGGRRQQLRKIRRRRALPRREEPRPRLPKAPLKTRQADGETAWRVQRGTMERGDTATGGPRGVFNWQRSGTLLFSPGRRGSAATRGRARPRQELLFKVRRRTERGAQQTTQKRTHPLDDLLLLDQEGAHDALAHDAVRQLAAVHARDRLVAARQALVAELGRAAGGELLFWFVLWLGCGFGGREVCVSVDDRLTLRCSH